MSNNLLFLLITGVIGSVLGNYISSQKDIQRVIVILVFIIILLQLHQFTM